MKARTYVNIFSRDRFFFLTLPSQLYELFIKLLPCFPSLLIPHPFLIVQQHSKLSLFSFGTILSSQFLPYAVLFLIFLEIWWNKMVCCYWHHLKLKIWEFPLEAYGVTLIHVYLECNIVCYRIHVVPVKITIVFDQDKNRLL